MNVRLTLTAAIAVILASVSLYPLIQGATWFWAGVGAVIAAAAAGTITRLPVLHATVASSVLGLIVAAPLLTNPAWYVKVVGVIVVAIAAAGRTRIRLLQALACVVTYLAALLIYLNAAFAARLSAARIVPTATSLHHLWVLAGQGLAERIYQPPVLGIHGIDLVAAAGIGVMAAATDLLAVRLRSPAIAGLPLLALYCVRITTNAKQGGLGATVVFSFGMIGYLALLAADGRERLRIWGRLVTVWHNTGDVPAEEGETPDTRALAASGRRIGLAAACIALVFPLLVPGVRVHDIFASTPAGAGTGTDVIALPNPLVEMQGQLLNGTPQTVLTYRTDAQKPSEQYLQIYVLNFNAGTGSWTLVPPQASTKVSSAVLRAAPGLAATTPTTESRTEIKFSRRVIGYGSKQGFLPLPYAPTSVRVSGDWLEDEATLMVYSVQPRPLSGLSYTVTSTVPELGNSQTNLAPAYPASIKDNYLGFSKGLHQQLAKLAASITKGARTPYQKALALQAYFHQPGLFTYNDTVTVPNNVTGLTKFLTVTRSGYCQQFAFAMAALARLLGIPSRVAVGYTAGNSEAHGIWKVTTADAHAWPELYFRNVGWLRFEPTPGGSGGQGTATEPQYAPPPGVGTTPSTTPSTGAGIGSKSGSGTNGGSSHIKRPQIGGGTTTGAGSPQHSIVSWILLIVAIILVLALVTPLTARSLIRRRRLAATGDAGLAHAAWRELRDNLADYGFACRPSESPRAVADRIATTLNLAPAAREALGRIVSAEERARYAKAPLSSQTLRGDTAAVRRALAQEADWRARWRARLLPASTLTPIRPGLQHALDVFGWMDAAGQKLRGRELNGKGFSGGIRQHG